MPIRRPNGKIITASSPESLTPRELGYLFGNVLPIGTVFERSEFFKKHLPHYEKSKLKVLISGAEFSLRPAWTAYHPSPGTHLIIIGHILFCHANKDHNWYYQPSTRLFTDNNRQRERQFYELQKKAENCNGAIPVTAKLLVRNTFGD